MKLQPFSISKVLSFRLIVIMKPVNLALVLIIVMSVFSSCKDDDPAVTLSEWNNVVLVNRYGYDLRDTIRAELSIQMTNNQNYTSDCRFIKNTDSTYIMESPVLLPSSEKALFFDLIIILMDGNYMPEQIITVTGCMIKMRR
jgi:hypothetical protein